MNREHVLGRRLNCRHVDGAQVRVRHVASEHGDSGCGSVRNVGGGHVDMIHITGK